MLQKWAENYQLLVDNMGRLIDLSGYRNDYLSQKIGLKSANFSVKKQKGTWSVDEVIKLLSIIENPEIENYMDDLRMKRSVKGKFITADAFEKRMGWK
ncbi:MAG TPA: hypothetical protein PKC39_05385 [Ferruginibacter sp.]|nr:hypothetical protein [Ferruginibacter sp.]HMP20374.1 hypothetical protein [Ferruginibacter sp.]